MVDYRDELYFEMISVLMGRLREREKKVLLEYYGLADRDGYTRQSLEYRFKLSRCRVWQLRHGALKKLRIWLLTEKFL